MLSKHTLLPQCLTVKEVLFKSSKALLYLGHWPDTHMWNKSFYIYIFYTETCQIAARSNWIFPHQWLPGLSTSMQAYEARGGLSLKDDNRLQRKLIYFQRRKGDEFSHSPPISTCPNFSFQHFFPQQHRSIIQLKYSDSMEFGQQANITVEKYSFPSSDLILYWNFMLCNPISNTNICIIFDKQSQQTL